MGIKVAVIDDEPLALRLLEQLMQNMEDCDIVGSFVDVELALEKFEAEPPDLILLDIEMPEIDGISLAAKIKSILPRTEIAFTTAYKQYAVDAFRVEALDYLLKPVTADRLATTMQRWRKRAAAHHSRPERQRIRVQCLGSLQLFDADGEPIGLKWRTAKIRELFAYLLHYRNQVVNRDMLLELLWPELNEHRGIANLQTSIYRIRRLLLDHGLQQDLSLELSRSGYKLSVPDAIFDTELWEQQISRMEPVNPFNDVEHYRLFMQYTGDYYHEYEYYWAEPELRRLKSLWLLSGESLGRYYVNYGKDKEALAVYHRIIQLAPLHEDGYFTLMRIYNRLKNPEAVESQFRLLSTLLLREADVEPGKEVSDWYKTWAQSQITHV